MPDDNYVIVTYTTLALPAKYASLIAQEGLALEQKYVDGKYAYDIHKAPLSLTVVPAAEINAILVADRMTK